MPSSPQTVTTATVFDYLLDSQGRALPGRLVSVTLDYSFANNVNPVVFLVPITATAVTDNNGYWQLSLVPNPNINPTGTTYSVEAAGQAQYQISVPSTAGPFQSSAILANTTVALSPATTGLTGPITVTGNETITGNLTVQGTTTLGAETAGTTTLGATQVQGDLTIASAFRLLFLAAASKIVPGATSFSIRDNADANDNLLVSNAGATTVRNGLTVTAGDAVVTAGRLLVSAAAAKILGGATSLSLRNNADSADNVLVTDAGAVTVRGALSASNINTTFHAEVWQAAAQTISNNTTTIVAFDTIESDPNGNITTGASAHYTAPVAGRYLVTAEFTWGASLTSDFASISVYKNAVEAKRGWQSGTGGTVRSHGVSAVIRASASDTIDIRVFQFSGGNGAGGAGQAVTYAQFTYLGPL